MTIKPLDGYEINAVSKVPAVLVMEKVAYEREELGDKVNRFITGQSYRAQILSKLSETTYKVKLEGDDKPSTIHLQNLGSSVQIGQKLLLRYVQEKPTLTFMLGATPSAASSAKLSSSARLINQHLLEATVSGGGVPDRYESIITISQHPQSPVLMAHDLKHALSTSGLFYESNLHALVQGKQSIPNILEQPQNKDRASISVLMAQQLAILEQQRMAWHGNVWPGQLMDWDIYVQPRENSEHQQTKKSSATINEYQSVDTELTIDFPNLGKVTTLISLINGHMRIRVKAEQMNTIKALKESKSELTTAIVNNGIILDDLKVLKYE